MRSAWSPARSRSFDTPFVVLPNCLLAFPTDFAIDFGSMSGRPLPIDRGSFTPNTVLRRVRLLRTMLPAMPTAAAPTAAAGAAALPAALFTVSMTPFPLRLLDVERLDPLLELRLVVLRFDDPLLELRLVVVRFDAALVLRFEPLP